MLNLVLKLTTMIARETKMKVAGICYSFLGFRTAIEVLAMRLSKQLLGKDITSYCAVHMSECYDYMAKVIDFSDIEIEMKGLNHDIWLTRFRYKGEDAYKYIDEQIKEEAEKYWSV